MRWSTVAWISKVGITMLASLSCLPGTAQAAAWQFDPAASLQGSYNDNFRLTTDDPGQGVFYNSDGLLWV